MKKAEVFYTWQYLACINYTGELFGGFKLIELEEGFEHCLKKFQTDYFIVFVLSGKLEITVNESKHWFVEQDEMGLLTDGYKIECLKPTVLICFTSDQPGNNGSKLLKRLGQVSDKISDNGGPVKICPALKSVLNLMKIYIKDGIACRHLQEQKQEEFFALLEEYYTIFELGNLFYPILNNTNLEFRKLVNAHYLYTSTASELSTLCGYKMEDFRKLFQQVYGMPVYQWMQQQKLKQVKYRLQDLNVSYKELSYELGFASVSHLNKFCQKWFGMSPSKYQEQLKAGGECKLD